MVLLAVYTWLYSETRSVSYGGLNRRSRTTDHQTDVGDLRFRNRFQAIEKHWFVRDRQQLFCGGVRDWPQPRA